MFLLALPFHIDALGHHAVDESVSGHGPQEYPTDGRTAAAPEVERNQTPLGGRPGLHGGARRRKRHLLRQWF